MARGSRPRNFTRGPPAILDGMDARRWSLDSGHPAGHLELKGFSICETRAADPGQPWAYLGLVNDSPSSMEPAAMSLHVTFLRAQPCRMWRLYQRVPQLAGAIALGPGDDRFDNEVCESFFAALECERLDRSRFHPGTQARRASSTSPRAGTPHIVVPRRWTTTCRSITRGGTHRHPRGRQ